MPRTKDRNCRKHRSLYASGSSLYLPQGSVVVGAGSWLQTLRTIPAGAGHCHCEESLRHSLDFTPANAGNMALAADITAAAVCWLSRQGDPTTRSEEHTSELQSLMRNSFSVFCLKKKNNKLRN